MHPLAAASEEYSDMGPIDYSNMSVTEMFQLYIQLYGNPIQKKEIKVDSSPGADTRAKGFADKARTLSNPINEISPLAKSLGLSKGQHDRLLKRSAARRAYESEHGVSFPAPATLQSAFGFGGNQLTGAKTGTAGDVRISDPVVGFNPRTKQFEILENK